MIQVVLCSLTALVILCTTQGDTETFSLTGAALAAACFSAKQGVSRRMVYQYFHGGICFCHSDRMVLPWTAGRLRRNWSFFPESIRSYFYGAVFAGGCIRLEAVWMLSDLWNGLMAFFNLTALIIFNRGS